MRLTLEQLLPPLRSFLAKRLVNQRGFTRREAATLLGLTPAAVTQYLRGRRAESTVAQLERSPEMVIALEELLEELIARRDRGQLADPHTLIVDGAYKLLTLRAKERAPSRRPRGAPVIPAALRLRQEQWIATLRRRLAAEQAAARRSMEFALRTQNELSKTLFRQIASDSLRHADIAASLIAYLGKGGALTRQAERPDPRELEAMIREEESAEEAELEGLRELQDPNVRLLVDSIEADERKHTLLLRGFLDAAKQGSRVAEHTAS
jgi:hypothetical protein